MRYLCALARVCVRVNDACMYVNICVWRMDVFCLFVSTQVHDSVFCSIMKNSKYVSYKKLFFIKLLSISSYFRYRISSYFRYRISSYFRYRISSYFRYRISFKSLAFLSVYNEHICQICYMRRSMMHSITTACELICLFFTII